MGEDQLYAAAHDDEDHGATKNLVAISYVKSANVRLDNAQILAFPTASRMQRTWSAERKEQAVDLIPKSAGAVTVRRLQRQTRMRQLVDVC